MKNPNRVFDEFCRGLNFAWKRKEPGIASRLLQKNKGKNEFALSDKICYKAVEFKNV